MEGFCRPAQQIVRTAAAVRHIAFHCRRLQTLGLQGCWKLTDAAVNFLANGCLQLCSVNLFDIRSLTNSAVATLTEKCKNLRFISISSRASVSMDVRWGGEGGGVCSSSSSTENLISCLRGTGGSDGAAQPAADHVPL